MKLKNIENRERVNSSSSTSNDMKRVLRKGDKVEIIGNTPFVLKDKPRPLFGRVTHVDGWYISVKPLWQRWQGEWYRNELRYVT